MSLLDLLYALLGAVAASFFTYRLMSERRQAPQMVPAVDPWQLQRSLMVSSDQRLPKTPTLTRDSLLYWALTCEELGETSHALVDCMLKRCNRKLANRNVTLLIERIAEAAATLKSTALLARSDIYRIAEFGFPLDEDEAVALLDGVTDVAVVNCGFALATGLPGAAGYLEVVSSNISKTNPSTGKIDKHPDGKWIKGVDYRPPDLAAILSGGCD